jgi:hypothetical protein
MDLMGVSSASWDLQTGQLHLMYDEKMIKLDSIHAKIASVGHDTEKVKAPDEVYESLPECCLFRDNE